MIQKSIKSSLEKLWMNVVSSVNKFPS